MSASVFASKCMHALVYSVKMCYLVKSPTSMEPRHVCSNRRVAACAACLLLAVLLCAVVFVFWQRWVAAVAAVAAVAVAAVAAATGRASRACAPVVESRGAAVSGGGRRPRLSSVGLRCWRCPRRLASAAASCVAFWRRRLRDRPRATDCDVFVAAQPSTSVSTLTQNERLVFGGGFVRARPHYDNTLLPTLKDTAHRRDSSDSTNNYTQIAAIYASSALHIAKYKDIFLITLHL